MSIKPPDFQLRFDLELPEEQSKDAALTTEEVRIRSMAAKTRLESGETWTSGKPPVWMQEYYQLLAGGWDWRIACYIAWKATPKAYRWPANQEQLARDVLGLTSDRQISVWRAKNPAIDAMVQDVGASRVLDRVADAIEAMTEVASTPNYKGKGDRELMFRMAGLLKDEVEITDKTGLPDLSKLTWEEKLKLAQLDTPDALEEFKKQQQQQDKAA